jgi:predicted MFS family arabinose efflux permease
MAVILTLYIEPLLSLALHNQYGLSNAWIGFFFLLSAVAYVIGAPLSVLLTKYLNRRYIILTAFLLMCVQNACLGPSVLLQLPPSLALLTLGTLLVGFNLSLAMVPLFSELIEIL